ncbi:MAG TPA: hypothetical protein VNQ73_05530 [Ilumatobacter sp.]|nr:hypothetical protein [Ilumatobacter sp.]
MTSPDVTSRALMVTGSALLLVSVFVPVMRWSVGPAHDTAGSARVFVGDGWRLVDGGFGGEWLLPVALVAGLVWGPLGLAEQRVWVRRVRWALAALAVYYPVWVAVVFVRKWEDDVGPAAGAVLLALAAAAMAAGWWVSRPSDGASASTDPGA